MQSIAALRCGRFFAVLLPLAWAQACCRTWLTQCRSRSRKISARRPTISSTKLKPWPAGRRVGPFAIPDATIIGGDAVGSAGGIVAVVTVNGVGGDH
jgi:hypothetical protein